MRRNTTSLLDQLAELKDQFSPVAAASTQQILNQLSRRSIKDTDDVVRYHEILLFLRAYPKSAALVSATENELETFAKRVSSLQKQGVDLAPLQHPEVSGIAGTSVTDTFSFYIVRWLLQNYPLQLRLDWDWFEDENRLAETWPRFIPLLEEDSFVEANIPYREWLASARKGRPELTWLVEQFDSLPKTDKERAELYDSQQLYVRWTPSWKASRTGMRLAGRKPFYHRTTLIQRRDIDLGRELSQHPPTLRKLSLRQGEKAIDMARAASTIRYRELYGFTHGDQRNVYHIEIGRGVELYLMGLPPEKRLPLRAYHAAMIYKNGVPIGYFEGLSLFERMESGFNLYYTFRDGETAWLYARTLNVMHHFTGVTAFSLDPYQIGYENEEGIESGAFWFYRKLGFRPTNREALSLTLKEEEKIKTRTGYRTPAATLRKLATSSMIFELNPERRGDWDRFQIRKVGFNALRAKISGNSLSSLASVLPGIKRWSEQEKSQLTRVVRAKAGEEEARYLKLMQRHERLRRAIIQLGSR